MALSIANIITDKASLAIKFTTPSGDESLNLHYSPSKLTPATIARMKKIEDGSETDQIGAVVQFLVSILVDWDFLNAEQTAVVPITIADLNDIPLAVLNAILEAIVADMSLGGAKEPRSKQA